jgi:hypothetical protein
VERETAVLPHATASKWKAFTPTKGICFNKSARQSPESMLLQAMHRKGTQGKGGGGGGGSGGGGRGGRG